VTSPGIILYGPPAAGKDTITVALHRLDARYVGFGKLKVADEHGDTTRYRLTTTEDLARLRDQGHVVYENARYRNRYVVDKPGLDAAFAAGHVPVVHMGQVAGVHALRTYPARWMAVLLWCPREITAQRARQRGSVDVDARLAAWDETLHDLHTATPADFVLRVDTDRHQPDDTAQLIDAALHAHTGQVTA
jgi:guanylate kinase